MTLSIIIPTHNRPFQVQQLLNSIAEQNFPKRNLQVLLVSNLRDKKLREKASYWEDVFFDFKYLEVGRKGVNKARNMGIRFARGDILYFLDDDCLLDNKDHLSLLVSEHEKSAVGIGGGYKSLGDSHGLEKFYQENTEQWIKGSSSEKQTEQLIGGNASYKRKVFDKGFYFDPSIVFGGSEEGFNRSLRAQGWTLLFVDKLSVFHNIKLSWSSFIKKSFKQGLGSAKAYTKEEGYSLKGKWAFLYQDSHSSYSLVYNLFFKLGFFWGVSAQGRKGKFFQLIRFIFLFFKSRWYFFRDYFAKWFYGRVLLRFLGNTWYVAGWLLRFLGAVWYVVGWLYGKVLWPMYTTVLLKPLGMLWYSLGWLYGKILWPVYTTVLLKPLGMLWYSLGWLYGKILWPVYTTVLLKPLGKLWYSLGWLYGKILWPVYTTVLLKPLGKLWYSLGWLYGKILWPVYTTVLLKPLGKLWYSLGWLYGRILWPVYTTVLLKPLGMLWYSLGWLYGKILWPVYTTVLLKPLGMLWYSLGWLYGKVLWPVYTTVLLKPLGMLWYSLGWLYGKILWPVYTTVLLKPLGMLWYSLGWLYGRVFLKVFGKLWYGLGWLYGHVLLFLFHHSPPMKLYYFSEYQYHKRIKPLLDKKRTSK